MVSPGLAAASDGNEHADAQIEEGEQSPRQVPCRDHAPSGQSKRQIAALRTSRYPVGCGRIDTETVNQPEILAEVCNFTPVYGDQLIARLNACLRGRAIRFHVLRQQAAPGLYPECAVRCFYPRGTVAQVEDANGHQN